MKKIVALVVLALVAAWIVKSRLTPASTSTSTAPAIVAAATPPATPKPTVESRPTPSAATPAAPVTPPAPVVEPRSTPVTSPARPYPPMSLADVLKPGNQFQDDVFGVSTVYPEGWSVREAMRWGDNNRENTVFFAPPEGSKAVPSMYYQLYPEGAPAPGEAEARLREMARMKEESRSQGGMNDYKNDPDSFVFREINGQPTLSYFATYTRGDQVQAEYFMRVLGPKGYVMYFIRGPVKDVQAVIPQVYQMGGATKAP